MSAIAEAYAHQTAVLGAQSWPEPTCQNCGADVLDHETDIDEDGHATLVICADCAPVPCATCSTVLDHPDMRWCSDTCRAEDLAERRAEARWERDR